MSADSRQLKGFLFSVLVWLPLAFLGWAVLATWLVSVPGMISGWTLTGLWPTLFSEVSHSGAHWQAVTDIMVRQHDTGAYGRLIFELKPMLYGYSVPLFFALLMATDLDPWERTRQGAIALPVLWLAQAFGMITGALKLVAFDAGAPGMAAAQVAGLPPNVAAFAYQFGYLILPSVAPVLLWMVLNRHFIGSLGRGGAEPGEP